YQKKQVRVHPHTWFFFDTFKNYTNYFLLYIIRLVQVIIALLDTGNRIVLGILFNFNIPVFAVVGIHLIKNRFEFQFTTVTDFLFVFDMDCLELARTIFQEATGSPPPSCTQYTSISKNTWFGLTLSSKKS